MAEPYSDKYKIINIAELVDDDEDLLLSHDHASINAIADDEAPIPVFTRSDSIKLNSEFESLDYDVCENLLWDEEQEKREQNFMLIKDLARWFLFLLIGICTALVACFLDIIIEIFSNIKYNFLKNSVDNNIIGGDLYIPYLFWILTNIIPVFIGATLVTYIEPIAAGSGIPQVKCYLNGIKIPRIVRIKTLAIKVIGVATSVVGGLAGGKEGPMIHSGAVIAAGLSQGKSTTFGWDFHVFKYFRDDHEKRDFVVGGAAAGVAAAFGAPIGGVLFSLEEAASFWNQNLIWRTVIASVVSSFTLNVVLSSYHGLNGLTYPGLFNLGEFEPLPYQYYELPIFVLMGMVGGLLGAIWNACNTKLNLLRKRFLKPKNIKILEAILVAALTATVACALTFSINDCRPLGNDPTEYPVQLFCEDNEYNAMAALWFQTPEASVKSLFHDPPNSHRIVTLALFLAVYYPLSCITFGLNVSLGIFIPTLLVGAAWGRLTAMTATQLFPTAVEFLHPGKYALIGAAAQLGGVLRMTISLSVILIESTGNVTFALPLIITLVSAKYMGDIFNEGIYDTQIKVSKVPMLNWIVPKEFIGFRASTIMNTPVVCIHLIEKASTIIDILKKYTYNGFPVIDELSDLNDPNGGRIKGFILRSQLIVILKNHLFVEKKEFWKHDVSIETFRNEYPRFPKINSLKLDANLLKFHIDLEMFMNSSPYTVFEHASVSRIFQLFRALGLRHLTVVNSDNIVVGIITRKDLIHH